MISILPRYTILKHGHWQAQYHWVAGSVLFLKQSFSPCHFQQLRHVLQQQHFSFLFLPIQLQTQTNFRRCCERVDPHFSIFCSQTIKYHSKIHSLFVSDRRLCILKASPWPFEATSPKICKVFIREKSLPHRKATSQAEIRTNPLTHSSNKRWEAFPIYRNSPGLQQQHPQISHQVGHCITFGDMEPNWKQREIFPNQIKSEYCQEEFAFSYLTLAGDFSSVAILQRLQSMCRDWNRKKLQEDTVELQLGDS